MHKLEARPSLHVEAAHAENQTGEFLFFWEELSRSGPARLWCFRFLYKTDGGSDRGRPLLGPTREPWYLQCKAEPRAPLVTLVFVFLIKVGMYSGPETQGVSPVCSQYGIFGRYLVWGRGFTTTSPLMHGIQLLVSELPCTSGLVVVKPRPRKNQRSDRGYSDVDPAVGRPQLHDRRWRTRDHMKGAGGWTSACCEKI